ncbi:MAG: TldD/PmbA family protein [Candidatus Aminicenantes bacterium]|nr:TldD/PmbA family protein [Candidatus Aminicenantes bacterium]
MTQERENNLDKEIKDLQSLAENLVSYGRSLGAEEIEVAVATGREFSVNVRLQAIEDLTEANFRYLSMKIIKDKKVASASSSDLSLETLKDLMRKAVKRAELANKDEWAGLPTPTEPYPDPASLCLYDPEIACLEPRKKIELAFETEKIALADSRITNSHGASFGSSEGAYILANSHGFSGFYKATSCSLSLSLQAGDTDNRVEDGWFSSKRFFQELDPPEAIAKKAVERTTRLLKPQKIKTQSIPVIFEPSQTAWLLGFLFTCVAGTSIYHRASFLVDKLGEKIATSQITVIDDGLIPGKLGSRPFDSEGVPTRKTIVIDSGILRNYLCNTYAARKLNLSSTGNAEGGGIGPNNFYLVPGELSPEEIIASLDRGLILVKTIGHGLNPVTGDISRGAFGLWVEKGEILYPVSEITIAGNLGEILNQIELIGSDLKFETSVCGPTIKVAELTVAGE